MRLPKTVGGWVGFIFKVSGAAVIASPIIRGVMDAKATAPSDPSYYMTRILYYSTGYDTNNGQINTAITTEAVASYVGGFVLVHIGKWISRALR